MGEAHTPGPWTAHECAGTFYVFADGQWMVADGETEEAWITRIRGVGRGATAEEQRANAELIAKAPEFARLLAAEQQARQAAERQRDEHRVPCRMCDGNDTAAAKNACCYNCRNRPYWDLESAQAERDAATRRVEELEKREALWLEYVQHLAAMTRHVGGDDARRLRAALGLDDSNKLIAGEGAP